jgi:hypothetical protein
MWTPNSGDVQVCVAPRSGDAALRLRLAEDSVFISKASEGGKSTPVADLTINEVLSSSTVFWFYISFAYAYCSSIAVGGCLF